MMEMSWQKLLEGSVVWGQGSPISRIWDKLWSEWLILAFAVLAVLIVIAAYIIAKIRAEPAKKEHQASDWLSKYSDLHSKGGLSDEEFRTIKTKLAEQLQDELNDSGNNG
jgi:uncharacterized membrane protein